MSNYSKETYSLMLDQMLSAELSFKSSFATPTNIKSGMKKILGSLIRQDILKGYAFLILDENLNVFVTITDKTGEEFNIELIYGD